MRKVPKSGDHGRRKNKCITTKDKRAKTYQEAEVKTKS